MADKKKNTLSVNRVEFIRYCRSDPLGTLFVVVGVLSRIWRLAYGEDSLRYCRCLSPPRKSEILKKCILKMPFFCGLCF